MVQVLNDSRSISAKAARIAPETSTSNLPEAEIKFSINWQAAQSGLPITTQINEILINNNQVARVSANQGELGITKEPLIDTPAPAQVVAESPTQKSILKNDPVRDAMDAQVKKHGSEIKQLKELINKGKYEQGYALAKKIGASIEHPEFADRLFFQPDEGNEQVLTTTEASFQLGSSLFSLSSGYQDSLEKRIDSTLAAEACKDLSDCSVIATTKEAYEFLKASEPWGSIIKYANPETGDLEYKNLPAPELVQAFIGQLINDTNCGEAAASEIANFAYRGEREQYLEYLKKLPEEDRQYLVSLETSFSLPASSYGEGVHQLIGNALNRQSLLKETAQNGTRELQKLQ